MSFLSRLRDTAKAVFRAIRDPSSYAPPSLPTQPPEPPPAPRPAAKRAAPRPGREPRPAPRISRPVPRSDLPASWGAGKAALWTDATKSEPRMARDENAQRFYDAAFFTMAETREQRELNQQNFVEFIWDEYGIDWDDNFDWESYREDYDTNAA